MLPSVRALSDPTAYSGAQSDSFDVVVPSIPGFGFSGQPSEVTDVYRMILTHTPIHATPDAPPGVTKKSPPLDRMETMVAYADKNVGRVVDHLESLGLSDNTVILFTGENGTDRIIRGGRLGDHDWPGGKGSNYVEMGTRVPLVMLTRE